MKKETIEQRAERIVGVASDGVIQRIAADCLKA